MDFDGPSLAPPEGVVPNFDNPPNKNALGVGVTVLCLAISTIAIVLRIYSVTYKSRMTRVQDYLIIAAFGTYVGFCYCSLWRISFVGTFVHMWDIRLRDLGPLLYKIEIASILYGCTMLVIKTAIMKEWIDIFVVPGTRNVFFWLCVAIIIYNFLFYSAAIIAVNLACIPREAIWDITIKGKCFNYKAMEGAGAGINLISDIIILAMPQRLIWGLKMSSRKKIGVSLVFAIGVFACISAIFRLIATIQYDTSEDSLYPASAASLWCIAEMCSGFLVFCVPVVPKAFKGEGLMTRVFSTLRSWNWRTRSRTLDSHEDSSSMRDKILAGAHYRKTAGGNLPLGELPPPTPPDSLRPNQHENRGESVGLHTTQQFQITEDHIGDYESHLQAQEQMMNYPWHGELEGSGHLRAHT